MYFIEMLQRLKGEEEGRKIKGTEKVCLNYKGQNEIDRF